MNAPTTARDAAVKVLMADFADLLERLERAQREHGELQDTQRLCHTELDADLEQLGGLVQGVLADLAKAGEAGRGMVPAAQRLARFGVQLAAPGLVATMIGALATEYLVRPGQQDWLVAIALRLIAVGVPLTVWSVVRFGWRPRI